jgi:CheY-like chemotaxis protein
VAPNLLQSIVEKGVYRIGSINPECEVRENLKGTIMGMKVLVVEDYEDSREFLRFLLEHYGCQVSEAANGYEAVEAVKRQLPDLVLMDISMPVMDGLTATRKIRESGAGRKLPIVAITAQGHTYYKKAIEAGCNDLIDKPLDFNALRPVLKRYLSI